MNRHWFVVISTVCVLSWSAPAIAKDGDHGKGHAKVEKSDHAKKPAARPEKDEGNRPKGTAGEVARAPKPGHLAKAPKPTPSPIAEQVVVIDRDGHRRVVTEYFSRAGLPPGLAKRQSLPPGLAKQLRERGHLPPGLQKRLVPIPAPLSTQLQPLPPYYSRYFAGRDLVIVDTRSNVVIAVVPNVLPRG